MSDLSNFRELCRRDQRLVATAVLLDGHDAVDFLSSSKKNTKELQDAARDLAKLTPEVRIPLLGTILRETNSEGD